ncbi:MAG TPA: CopG family antitoxin [Candidatus Paceibacterota bacterium]
MTKNPFKNLKLDKEEREILRSYERGEWKRVPLTQKERARIQTMARNTLLRNRNINIRISERTLHKLKTKAAEKGLPYQTLIASILHQYDG